MTDASTKIDAKDIDFLNREPKSTLPMVELQRKVVKNL